MMGIFSFIYKKKYIEAISEYEKKISELNRVNSALDKFGSPYRATAGAPVIDAFVAAIEALPYYVGELVIKDNEREEVNGVYDSSNAMCVRHAVFFYNYSFIVLCVLCV